MTGDEADDAVAPLTRFAGEQRCSEPPVHSPRLTWTGLDVGGPWLEASGRIQEMKHLPSLQGLGLQEATPAPKRNRPHLPFYWLPFTSSAHQL